MIKSAEDKVIVTVTTKYIKHISDLLKRAALENNTSIDPSDYVNITGTIISLPKRISNTRDYKGFSIKDIQVGDTAIFSSNIIYDLVIKAENEEPVYKNLITFKGQEYWVADITKIFGVIRNGEIIMINGYVMATPFTASKIYIPAAQKKSKQSASSQIMHIGNPKETLLPIDVKQGDTIHFNPMIATKYQINDKHFIILQQHQILGKNE